MLIKNACVVMPEKAEISDVRISGEKIEQIKKNLDACPGEEIYDASGCYLLAGFIDSHMHGAVGQVFSSEVCDVKAICAYEAGEGVTAVAPTLLAMSIEDIKKDVKGILPYIDKDTGGAKLVGFHSEGPFLNPAKKGAMNPDSMSLPSIERFERIYDACGGNLKIMTIAPEMPGALEVISFAAEKGVALSAGHTDASFEQMKNAIDAGVTRMTHTFNACRAFNHREPGVLGAALTDDRITCEVICDFAHLHPAAVEMIYKVKGYKNFTAISDSEFGAGLQAGRLVIDGLERVIKDGLVWLGDGKTIAGAASSLHRAFKNLLSLGIPVCEVSHMLSATPAKALNIFDSTGSIEKGKCADVCIVNCDTLEVVKTYVGGKAVL